MMTIHLTKQRERKTESVCKPNLRIQPVRLRASDLNLLLWHAQNCSQKIFGAMVSSNIYPLRLGEKATTYPFGQQ